MFKKILALVAVAAVLAVAAGFLLPAEVEVHRSTWIDAPSEAVHGVVARPRSWPTWTAWNRDRDPSVVHDFFGPARGTGAGYTWQGDDLGEGRLTITRSHPAAGIEFDAEFEGGKYRTRGALRLTAEAGGTRATWGYHAELGLNPISRYFGLLTDRMLGPDLEAGLRRLKTQVEAGRRPPAARDPGASHEVPNEV